MKKIVVGLSLVLASLLGLAGCKVQDQAKVLVEKSYTLVVKAIDVIQVAQDKVGGGDADHELGTTLKSVLSALTALKATLERVALYVGAELPRAELLFTEYDTVPALDLATADLLDTLKQIK